MKNSNLGRRVFTSASEGGQFLKIGPSTIAGLLKEEVGYIQFKDL